MRLLTRPAIYQYNYSNAASSLAAEQPLSPHRLEREIPGELKHDPPHPQRRVGLWHSNRAQFRLPALPPPPTSKSYLLFPADTNRWQRGSVTIERDTVTRRLHSKNLLILQCCHVPPLQCRLPLLVGKEASPHDITALTLDDFTAEPALQRGKMRQ